MSLPYDRTLISHAKELRKHATRHENHLWYDFLRTYPVRFQRQKTIGRFVVDFYCDAAKLVVELDGSQHYTEEGMRKDAQRTAVLTEYGIQILRFSNLDIDRNFSGVCTLIDDTVKEIIVQQKGG